MSVLIVKSSEWCNLSIEEAKSFGANILGGILPKAKKTDGGEVKHKYAWGYAPYDHDFGYLTNDNEIKKHIDFEGCPFTFIYDLGSVQDIEKIHIGAFAENSGNYCLNDFSIFASNNRETLFCEENKIVSYKRDADEEFSFNGELYKDFVYEVEGSTRYFAFKDNGACPSDKISRISRIGLFSKKFSELYNFVSPAKTMDCLAGLTPEISGKFEGAAEDICNYRKFEGIKASDDLTLTFKSEKNLSAEELYIFGENVELLWI